jgi:hypothetical protein
MKRMVLAGIALAFSAIGSASLTSIPDNELVYARDQVFSTPAGESCVTL